MQEKEELIEIIKKYTPEDIVFGKDAEYLCFRNNCSIQEFIEEIFSFKNLEIVIKQNRDNEERFALYFIYSKSKGRAYILRFYPEKIRVITIFPMGKRTLNKYFKRKFKKEAFT